MNLKNALDWTAWRHTTPTDNLDESADITPDEMLDWLCWRWASMGERFYPPEKTAEECIESIEEWTEVDDYTRGSEYGRHVRAWLDAVEVFDLLDGTGFDPVGRAKRHRRESALDLEPIDWEWWDDV